jgi:hypothetical protein
MHRLFLLLFSFSLMLTSCSDGDIITVDLEFSKILYLCGDENSANYVIYDVKNSPDESLTLLFTGSDTNDLIFKPEVTPYEGAFGISTTTKFNYRTYDGDPLELICQEIPSSAVNIIKDYPASSGTVEFSSIFEDVDNTRTVTVTFKITNTDLEILNADDIELGSYTHSYPVPN